MRLVRLNLSISGVLLVLMTTLTAHADDETLRLTWTAPAGCPSTDDVRAATLRGIDTRNAKGGLLEADARVEQQTATKQGQAGSWKVRLRTRHGGATGEREIEATTCSGVADATAVLLALALVPPGSAPEPPLPPAPLVSSEAPRPSQSDVGTAAEQPRRPEPRRDRGHLLALGASAAADASTLPATAVGGALTVALTPGRARIELDARRWVSQSQAASNPATAGARFSMTSLGARGCFAALKTQSQSLDLSPCLGGDVHLISAPGYGADANYSASAAWTTITGGALGRVSLTSWLALRTRLEAFVPLTRPTFVVENAGTVHRPPTIGAAASFGAEVLFL